MNADTPTSKNRKRTPHLALGIATAAVAALVLTSCEMPSSDDRKTDSESFKVTEEVKELSLKAQGGDVTITASDTDTVKVKTDISYSDNKPKTTHSVSGGKLTVKDSGCEGNCGIDYTISVPKAVALDLSTDGGKAEGKGVQGDVTVTTNGGDAKLTGLGGNKADAKTGGGDLELAFTGKPESVQGATGGGSLSVTVPSGAYAVDSDASGGEEKIDVKKDSGAPNKIGASTEGGDLKVLAG